MIPVTPPRIALLLPDACPGGAERVMLLLAKEFASRGFLVDLVLVRAIGGLLADVPAGVRVVPLLVRPSSVHLRLALAALPALRSYLRRESPVVLLSTLTGTNLLALLARRWLGGATRIVVREASTLANVRSAFRRALIRWLYVDASGVVAVSRGVAADLAAHGVPAGLITTIPNPIDAAHLLAQSRRSLDLAGLVPSANPIVLSVGRLVEAKDYGTLIEAFALVRRRRAAALLIIGEGPLRNALQQRIRLLGLDADVQLPGHLDNPYPAFVHSSVFVLSSRWEGYPNALLEALHLGLRIVATDCDHGPREILDHGRRGTLVPVGDVDAMAVAIERALDDAASQRPGTLPPAPAVADAGNGLDDVTKRYLAVLLGSGHPMRWPH